jgi:peptide deformylase
LFGDPVLRMPAAVVTDFDLQLRNLVGDLAETMLAAPGSGLAAPQIGIGLRVFAYHVDDEQAGHLVNPVLHFPDAEEQDGPEGCLSIPGLAFDCRRKAHVVAHGQNMWGDPVTIEGTATLARCIQHETDHLDGVLFVDRLDPETRKDAMRAIREADWSNLGAPTVKLSPHPTGGLAL